MEGGLQEREETLRDGNGGSMSVHGLHQAAANGDVAEMRRLVATGVDVNEQGVGGPTALHAAASNGHVEAIKTLVQLGAQTGVRDAVGETALDLSVRLGHHEVAQVLRHFKRTVRPRGKGRRGAQPTTREDTPEAREAAERMAALLLEEEEEELAKAAGTRTQEVSGGRAMMCCVSPS